MSDVIQDIRSLPLFQIIGAPLLAIVQAEAQAAQTTLEYIEKVGFKPKETETDGEEGADIGDLRMASFTYQKQDENGEYADFKASVPVLSLVPIPAIQVRDGSVNFAVKITDVKTETAKTTANPPTSDAAKKRYVGWLQPARTELRASMASRTNSKTARKTEGTYQLDIEVNVERAEFPAGLTKILDIMDQAIKDSKKD